MCCFYVNKGSLASFIDEIYPERKDTCNIPNNICDCTQYIHGHYTMNCPKISESSAEVVIESSPYLTKIKCKSQYTNFKSYVPSFQKIRSISTLEIDNCALPNGVLVDELDEVISKIFLRSLILRNVTNLHSGVFSETTIDSIYIHDTDLRSKLNHLNTLDKIRTLGFENTKLESLDILNLPNLIKLESTRNPIKNISRETFKKFPKLELLYLKESDIENIPEDTFNDVTKLITLYIDSKKLTNVPRRLLSELKNLRVFKLENKNKTLPMLPNEFFKGLNGLFKIEIRCGLLEIQNTTFQGMTNIMTIVLSDNYLKELPTNLLTSLRTLMVLNLSGNSLSELNDETFSNNMRLTVLDLSYNSFINWSE